MITDDDFGRWLQSKIMDVPLTRWGRDHTKIAVMFANDMIEKRSRQVLDEALNSGDGSFKP